MRTVRIVFAWCFLLAAIACLVAAILFLSTNVTIATAHALPGAGNNAVLAGVALGLASLFASAWWFVLRDHASGNHWGLAAGLAIAVFGLMLLRAFPLRPLNPAWIPILVGIGSGTVFASEAARGRKVARKSPSRPIPGDGTSPLVNKLVLVAGAAGGIGGVRILLLWALAHGLQRGMPPFFVPQMVFAILVVLAIHEAGHAVAGALLRMKVIGFVVGPFYWSYQHGKTRFIFRRAGLVAFGGQTMVAPTTMENFRNRKALQVAGGPIASLLAGAAAVAAIRAAPGRPWAGEWTVLAVFADITILVGLLNLVPFGNKSMYSDGAKLYQLLCGGLWTRYHRALGIISSIAVTTLRPRDYDIATLEEAAGTIARGRDEAFLWLCAYSFYLDSGRTAEAIAAIGKAEATCKEQSIDPPVEWCAAFVFANAVLRQDAAGARSWWNRMESNKTFHFTENLWTARGALALSESRIEESADALAKAEARAEHLPHTGSGESERGIAHRLRLAFDEACGQLSSRILPVSAN